MYSVRAVKTLCSDMVWMPVELEGKRDRVAMRRVGRGGGWLFVKEMMSGDQGVATY